MYSKKIAVNMKKIVILFLMLVLVNKVFVDKTVEVKASIASEAKEARVGSKLKGTYYIALNNHSGKKLSYNLKVASTKVKTSTSVCLRVKNGKTLKLGDILDIDGKVSYKSANKKIAIVNKKGEVTGKKVGSAQIVVYSSTQKKEIIVKLKVK